MLRILLWKLGIEWAHLRRVLRPGGERLVYYFAYGANLRENVRADAASEQVSEEQGRGHRPDDSLEKPRMSPRRDLSLLTPE